MYGHTWASQYGDQAAGSVAETWGAALAGLTPQHLADGLRACVAEGREYPPGAPRFRAMCLGVPTFERVLLDLRKPDTASRFARAVWMHVDAYAYRSAEARAGERMLRAAYGLAHDAVMRGEPLPEEPVGRLDVKPPRPPKITPGVAESKLAECRAILEPTAEERAAEQKRQQEREEALRIARELAQRGNEPAPLPDEPGDEELPSWA